DQKKVENQKQVETAKKPEQGTHENATANNHNLVELEKASE
ncbi:ErpL protein, partial [Bacillus cereus]